MLKLRLHHRLGGFTLDAAFTAGPGVTALFGRSGAGKTTVVNAIAGLLRPDRGRIALDGEVLLDSDAGRWVPPHRRRVGYVFQEARLFPHLSVRRNLEFGRFFAGRRHDRQAFDRIVDLLGISSLLDRRPRHLSGGERQRVAIGRALLACPRLLLLDEPLASLDRQRRAEILPFLERLRDEGGVPMVLVSHQMEEVARLAATLVLMADGRAVAAGPVEELAARPELQGWLGGYDPGMVLPARVAGRDAGWALTLLQTPAGLLTIPDMVGPPGTEARIRIRSRDVLLSPVPPDRLSTRNALPATIAAIGRTDDALVRVVLDCAGHPLAAGITAQAAAELGLAPGVKVWAIIRDMAVEGG